jgi:uncharacterized membrane protein
MNLARLAKRPLKAKLESPHYGSIVRKGGAMSETGLEAVLLMIGTIMLVVCFWKQIALLILFSATIVFCFGVYYIVSIIDLY